MQEALKFHHDSKQERGLGPIVMPIVVDALEKKYHEQITPFSGSQTPSSTVRRWSSSCVLYALLPTERPLAALRKDPLVLVYLYALSRTGTRYVLKLIRSILAICSSPSKLK